MWFSEIRKQFIEFNYQTKSKNTQTMKFQGMGSLQQKSQ